MSEHLQEANSTSGNNNSGRLSRNAKLSGESGNLIKQTHSSKPQPVAATNRQRRTTISVWPLQILMLYLELSSSFVSCCQQLRFGDHKLNNIACKCDINSCDKLQFSWPQLGDAFVRVSSDKSGARFELQPEALQQSSGQHQFEYRVETNTRRQQVIGYGGAFTDSASQLIMSLPAKLRESLIEDYFGEQGLDYNMGRLPLGGTDMSTRPYSYDDLPNGQLDLSLKHFRLQAEDFLYKIPAIKLANELRVRRGKEQLKLMALSWSAPAWMKNNQNLVQGHMRSNSSGPFCDAYARYLIKAIDEYERLGIRIWSLSPQNEPNTPARVGPEKINFNSVNFDSEEMSDYLENSLVPNLLRAGKTGDKLKLFLWEDTLDGLVSYQRASLASASVREFAHGLAIHWYAQGLDRVSYKMLHEARNQLPPKLSMISTEASFIGRPKPGDWFRGQKYARDVIENLRAGSLGWLDWNLALDTEGGPAWSNNNLDASILVDPHSRSYLKNPMFYALAHFTRFIVPDSHIVQSQLFVVGSGSGRGLDEPVAGVAAELPTRTESGLRRFALVLLNRAEQSKTVKVKLVECRAKLNESSPVLELAPNSISSLAFNC